MRGAPLRATRSNMRDVTHELVIYLLLFSLFILCDRVVENFIYVRVLHLLWLNFVVKGTFDRCCTDCSGKGVGDALFGTGQEANIGSRFY